MQDQIHYAEPMVIDQIKECTFYHCMDLPDVGTVGTGWDLRATVDAYLGEYDFRGKRVLDVGAASGYLSFELEKRGAEVVSFDMDSGAQWDIVPYFTDDARFKKERHNREQAHIRLKKGYWFAHRALQSNARVYYGDIYHLPEALGPFDVVFLGMILSHLRDPFQALYSASRLSTDTVIITNQTMQRSESMALFLPDPIRQLPAAWWSFSDGCLQRMLEVLGFQVIRTLRHLHRCIAKGREGLEHCTAFVAQRQSVNV